MKSRKRSSLVQHIKRLRFEELQLCGRDAEVETLEAILGSATKPLTTADDSNGIAAKATRTKTPFVLVRGYSGVGKSALLKSGFEDENKCFFCLGKHEQTKENQFDAWNEALEELFTSLEDDSEDLFTRVQTELEEELDAQHIRQLKGTFPAMNRVFFTHQTKAKASSDHFGTTKAALVRLIGVVAKNLSRENRALVLCLEDLHWSDYSALALLLALATETPVQGLVLVGTYRDNEVIADKTHILNTFLLSELKEKKCDVTEIALQNLTLEAINEVASSLLQMRPEKTLELAEVVLLKTNGNIFFALQFFRTLHEQKLLYFSVETYEWAWDLEQITTDTDLSENVVELVTLKLSRLPPISRRFLMVGSCFGAKFHEHLVRGVLEVVLAKESAATGEAPPVLGGFRSPGNGPQNGTPASPPPSNKDDEKMKVTMDEKDDIVAGSLSDGGESQGDSVDYEYMIQEGLLTYQEGFFRFCHDRIEQAAYELFETPMEREHIHLIIGRYLQERVAEEEADGPDPETPDDLRQQNLESLKMLCCEQLNLGSRCIGSNYQERLELARLNMEAGELASCRSAFLATASFLRAGLSLLKGMEQDPWVEHYNLVLKMHNLLASVLNTRGDYDQADQMIETVLQKARTEGEKRFVYAEKVKLLMVRNQMKEAKLFGIKSLKTAGIRVPMGKIGLHHVLFEFFKAKKRLKKIRSPNELVGMAECQDEEKRLVICTLNQVASTGFFLNEPNLMTSLYLRSLSLSLKHGLSKYTAFGMVMYACILGGFGDFEAAYDAGKIAVQLTVRFDARECSARTMACVFCFTKHLKEPLQSSLDGYLKNYSEGIEGGDTEYAICNLTGYTETYLFLGMPLQPLLKDLKEYKEHLEEFEKTNYGYIFEAFAQGIHCIWGNAPDPYMLNGDFIQEGTFLKDVRDNFVARWGFYFVKLFVAYHLNQQGREMERAAEAFWSMKNPLVGTPNFFLMNCSFLNGMVAMSLEAKARRKRRYRRIRERSIGLIKTWEKKGVPWVSHLLLILYAERDRLNPKKGEGEVKAAYDAAIRMASRTGCISDCALANERCARYFFDHVGDEGWGNFYLKNAITLYMEWGAGAKLDLMSKEFPVAREEISAQACGSMGNHLRSGTVRARERFKASSNEKHFAKISDLFSKEFSSTSLQLGSGAMSIH